MNLSFGEKIKEARKLKGFTQKQLAVEIGAKHNSVSDWENNKNKPDPDTIELLCGVLDITPNYLLAAETDAFSPSEKLIISRYRSLDEHGKESINMMLERESERAKALKAHDEQLAAQAARIAELEAARAKKEQAATLIELQPYRENTSSVPYFRGGVSAGNGVFVLGNEATDELEIPDIPKYKDVDYALDVNGVSMEPDYTNGDIVLVSHGEEMSPGDIGVFIIDGSAYIKELGHTELISRNKNFPNISLHEGNNIVCMGKVMGKFEKV